MSINASSSARFSGTQPAIKFQGQGLSEAHNTAIRAASLLGQSGLQNAFGVSTASELAVKLQNQPDLIGQLNQGLDTTASRASQLAGWTA